MMWASRPSKSKFVLGFPDFTVGSQICPEVWLGELGTSLSKSTVWRPSLSAEYLCGAQLSPTG